MTVMSNRRLRKEGLSHKDGVAPRKINIKFLVRYIKTFVIHLLRPHPWFQYMCSELLAYHLYIQGKIQVDHQQHLDEGDHLQVHPRKMLVSMTNT